MIYCQQKFDKFHYIMAGAIILEQLQQLSARNLIKC